VSGMLIAVGYLMIRVFDRLAPAPESEDSLHGP
jgi:hypothetical protein